MQNNKSFLFLPNCLHPIASVQLLLVFVCSQKSTWVKVKQNGKGRIPLVFSHFTRGKSEWHIFCCSISVFSVFNKTQPQAIFQKWFRNEFFLASNSLSHLTPPKSCILQRPIFSLLYLSVCKSCKSDSGIKQIEKEVGKVGEKFRVGKAGGGWCSQSRWLPAKLLLLFSPMKWKTEKPEKRPSLATWAKKLNEKSFWRNQKGRFYIWTSPINISWDTPYLHPQIVKQYTLILSYCL